MSTGVSEDARPKGGQAKTGAEMTVIWHNPRCTKSRQTLKLLQDNGIEPTVRRYLDDPPTLAELQSALGLLGLDARGLMRRKEAIYRELGLKAVTDEAALQQAMIEHPKLIERPIVFHEGKAAIGRPPEAVLGLFGAG